MADALDRDLEEAIRELEQMKLTETQKTKKRIVLGEVYPPDSEVQILKLKKANPHHSTPHNPTPHNPTPHNPVPRNPVPRNPARSEWDTAQDNTVTMPGNRTQVTDGSWGQSGSILRPPGNSGHTFGNRIQGFFDGFSVDGERVLNIVLFIITLGILWMVFSNFNVISVKIATFFLKTILTIGEILVGIILLVIIWIFIRSRMRRRRWMRW